jgi:predicted AlkP superfamily pyrophosphatase or phosphodiesterase
MTIDVDEPESKCTKMASFSTALLPFEKSILYHFEHPASRNGQESMMFVRRIAPFLLTVAFLFAEAHTAPRLIVVISVDQFRYDYLTRFAPYLGEGGFRRLSANGASFTNASYKHAFNMTGPGHAAILTGTYGNLNGIITNSWYDRERGASVYCAEDRDVHSIGYEGKGRSPANLIAPTFGDELRLDTGFKGKVVSVSNKDRVAIFMGGKLAHAAYWMEDSVFGTSSYYMQSLPSWVEKFNSSRIPNSYFGKTWNRTLPESAYALLDKDDVPYESNWSTIGKAFPHRITGKDTTHITESYYWALLSSPFGMDVLSSFARAAIDGEQLGADATPDLLCIGYSSTDYVGHGYGPNSREILEIVVQFDRVLAEMITYLDRKFGLENVIIAVTSDHGVTAIPEYIRSQYPSAATGRISRKELDHRCETTLTNRYGKIEGDWIDRVIDGNVYLNRKAALQVNRTLAEIAATLADSMLAVPEMAIAVDAGTLTTSTLPNILLKKLQRSFHPARSGDVLFALKPFYYLEEGNEGAEHGAPYEQDAHVPLLLMGKGLRPGVYLSEASPIDIGPTLSAITGIEFPAEREGRVLTEALDLTPHTTHSKDH